MYCCKSSFEVAEKLNLVHGAHPGCTGFLNFCKCRGGLDSHGQQGGPRTRSHLAARAPPATSVTPYHSDTCVGLNRLFIYEW